MFGFLLLMTCVILVPVNSFNKAPLNLDILAFALKSSSITNKWKNLIVVASVNVIIF